LTFKYGLKTAIMMKILNKKNVVVIKMVVVVGVKDAAAVAKIEMFIIDKKCLDI